MNTQPIKLSKRQKQLFAMLERGLSNCQIAAELEISEHTVKVHFWRLFTRIGVNSRGQALKWWKDNQPAELHYAMNAAFYAACRLADSLKVDGGEVNIAEFEHHRIQVQQMQGARAC